MFLINSRLSLFTAATRVAPLLPKLRGHFAEFLNKGSPVRLRIFSSSTCVGLRYGHLHLFSSFSRQREFTNFPTLVRSSSHPSLMRCVLHYTAASVLERVLSINAPWLSFCVPASLSVSVVLEYPPVVHHLRLSAST